MSTATDTPDSGQLPGRLEWAVEPTRGEVPSNPDWNRFSDVIRSFDADEGASLARQDGLGTPDAVDHNRGPEDPSLSIGYDMQQFFVDGSGDPKDASGYVIKRDEYNRLEGTLTVVYRREYPGGNDDAGVREYTVVRGAAGASVTPTLDPSQENPILLETEWQPVKVRSYLIHQPSAGTTLDVVSDDDSDTSQTVTIEDEDAGTTEDVDLNGTTTQTTTASFSDIDAVWIDDTTDGTITITDGSGTTLMTIEGGNTYSDDDQPVDGDRGVPALGSGSHASAIGSTYEHFLGDRFERPSGSPVRPRVNSASWTVENDITTDALHSTRAPTVDEGDRTVTVEADVGGEWVSHSSMMDALQKSQAALEHEFSGGTVTFKNTVPTDSANRQVETGEGVASLSETLEASGDPPITLTAN